MDPTVYLSLFGISYDRTILMEQSLKMNILKSFISTIGQHLLHVKMYMQVCTCSHMYFFANFPIIWIIFLNLEKFGFSLRKMIAIYDMLRYVMNSTTSDM